MQTNKITPWGETIVNEQSNICQIFDHMVAPKFINLLTIDIKKFNDNVLPKLIKNHKIDGVIGGPPCQGYSTARLSNINEKVQENMMNNQFTCREFIMVYKHIMQ
jgi:site-specific DNA-cytosine methylase